MTLGVERYGLKVKDLARALEKTADGMTQTIARGSRRKNEDRAFRKELEALDSVMAETREDWNEQ